MDILKEIHYLPDLMLKDSNILAKNINESKIIHISIANKNVTDDMIISKMIHIRNLMRNRPIWIANSTTKKIFKHFEIHISFLDSKTRRREIVKAKQISQYFTKKKTKLSLDMIGQLIGNKDHATVLHSIKTVNNLMDTDKIYKSEIEEIERMLNKNYETKATSN